ncbi:MAG TPA: tetratricopeptide repeat protein [Steroidobacteraceae bacterium]
MIRHGVDLKITRLLLQIGLMCGELGKFPQAERICASVRDFRADIPHPGCVLALIYVRQNRMEAAEKELDAVLAAFPDHQLARALLGLVYHEVGRADWSDVLQQVIADGREEWSVRLARGLLGTDAPTCGAPRATAGKESAASMQRLYA